MSRRALPEHERQAVAAEIRMLLTQRDEHMRRIWTTESLGKACGDITHETIRRARDPSGVGPAVRQAILAVTGQTMEQLMAKHGVTAGGTPLPLLPDVAAERPPMATATTPGAVVHDRLVSARKVLEALEEDGFPREFARGAVGAIAIDSEWDGELDLYRKARAILERRTRAEDPHVSTERPVRAAPPRKHSTRK